MDEATEPPEHSDRDLLDRFHLGDATAFEELVERYQRPIHALAYRMVRNAADAEEVGQEVFVRAYRSLESFRRASSLKTWLFKIAINLSIDRMRRPRLPQDPLDPTAHAESGLEALERKGLQARLEKSIADLPNRQRATLVLRVFHELSFKEIGEVLGSPIGTVKANYHHAVSQLRAVLRERRLPLIEAP